MLISGAKEHDDAQNTIVNKPLSFPIRITKSQKYTLNNVYFKVILQLLFDTLCKGKAWRGYVHLEDES